MSNIIKQFPVDAGTSDANYRLFGSGVNSMLTSLGFVQTSDTGQANWSTATRTNSNTSEYFHYDVWRFNDTLQETAPIFFKMYYGRGGHFNTSMLGIEIGQATNGSGGIINSIGPNDTHRLVWGLTSDSGPKTHMASSDMSGLIFLYGIDATATWSRSSFILERLRNIDGSPNNKGYILRYGYNGEAPTLFIYDCVNNIRYTSSGGNALMPMSLNAGQSSVQKNGNFPVAPIHIFIPGVSISRSKMAVVYTAADLGLHGTIRITHQQMIRTYRCLGSTYSGQDSYGTAGYSLAAWWND